MHLKTSVTKLLQTRVAFVRADPILVVPACLLLFVLIWSIVRQDGQQYSDLALAFMHGHLYFLHSIGGVYNDPVLYNHHQYWSDGPFPALVLLPFVALFSIFHATFYQGYIDWLLILGTIYFIYSLARRFKYDVKDSLVLTFGFTLGSAYIGTAAISNAWMYAQILTTFLLFWSLHEYFNRKRWWLIGLLCGCIFLSRATATPVVLFFALEAWWAKEKQPKLIRLIPFALPVVGAIAVQAVYNFLRFHNPLEAGSRYQVIDAVSAQSRTYGVFSLYHVPNNLFDLLFRAPRKIAITANSWILKFPYIEYNQYGTSIFVISPYLLYLLGRKWAVFSRTSRHLLIAAACSCLAVLCFFGVGRNQLGDRYSLDFLPELFIVLMLVYRVEHTRLTRGMTFLLLAAGIFNYYLLIPYIMSYRI